MQVTVSEQADRHTVERARRIGSACGLEYRERPMVDWSRAVLVVTRSRLVLREHGRDAGWHPGLLHTRMEAGARHPLARAMRPVPGAVVLDATLGFGTDAVFLARAFGVRVVGVEIVPILALMTAEGLRRHEPRVRVMCGDSTELLASMRAGSVDHVYFDPLFPGAVDRQPSLGLVRRLGCPASVSRETIDQARRVARRSVVIKAEADSDRIERLGADRTERSRSRTWYGVFDV